MVETLVSERISGLCGLLSPLIAFFSIFVSIGLHPWFSWTEHALSDLGAIGTPYNVVYNFGLIISGIIFLMFTFGLRSLLTGRICFVGVWLLSVSAISLAAIDVFPSGTSPHRSVTSMFYGFAALALIIIGVGLIRKPHHRPYGILTLLLVIMGLIGVLAFPWTSPAIPEIIGAVVIATWGVIFGIQLLTIDKTRK